MACPYHRRTPGRLRNALTLAFHRRIRDVVGPDRMFDLRVALMNRASDTCPMHDFCDANQVMLDAFAAVAGREADLSSDADTRLIDEAWTFAQSSLQQPPA